MVSFRNPKWFHLLGSILLFVAAPCLRNASATPVAIEHHENLSTADLAFADVPSGAAEADTSIRWNQDVSVEDPGFTEPVMTLATDASLDPSQKTVLPDGGTSKARVPEPSALLLFGTGLAGLAAMSHKRA